MSKLKTHRNHFFWKPSFTFLLLLVLRLVSVVAMRFRGFSVSPVQDPLEYRLIALNLLHYGTFSIFPFEQLNPDLLRGPGYSIFLAGSYLFEMSGYLAVITQQVLVIATGWLLYMIMRRFRISATLSLLGAILVILEPMSWFLSLTTRPEVLATFFIVASAAIFSKSIPLLRNRLYISSIVGGLSLGFAVLMRPTTVLAVPFLVAFIMFDQDVKRKLRLRAVVTALVMIVFVMMPWIARNYSLTGRVMLSNSFGFNLVQGLGNEQEYTLLRQSTENIVDADGRMVPNFETFSLRGFDTLNVLSNGLIEREGLFRLGLRQISCAPNVWFGHDYDTMTEIILGQRATGFLSLINRIDQIVWSIALFLASIGAYIMLHRKELRIAGGIFLAIIALTLFVNVCMSYARMLMPMYPFIIIFVILGGEYIVKRLRD